MAIAIVVRLCPHFQTVIPFYIPRHPRPPRPAASAIREYGIRATRSDAFKWKSVVFAQHDYRSYKVKHFLPITLIKGTRWIDAGALIAFR